MTYRRVQKSPVAHPRVHGQLFPRSTPEFEELGQRVPDGDTSPSSASVLLETIPSARRESLQGDNIWRDAARTFPCGPLTIPPD